MAKTSAERFSSSRVKIERGMIAFFGPPLGHSVKGLRSLGRGLLDQAQDVQVGVAFAEFRR